jgi:hypothetical protein
VLNKWEMPVVNEKAYVHVRVKNSLAKRLRKIAFSNHRRGVQTDTNLAVEEYCQRHEVLTNKRDNGK